MIIKNFNPFPELETERLYLRKITEKDLDDLYKLLSDPDVAKYEYFHPVKSDTETRRFIKRYETELMDLEEITWGLSLKESGRLIGTLCLGDFDDDARRAEIGYAVTKNFWGSGYATEAAEAVLKYGFEVMNLNRIEATVTPGNEGSLKVLRKLNFTLEGIVRERDLIKGKLEDGIIMSILRKEYN